MFSNKVWGLDASPRKLLSLCCGFFSSPAQGGSGGRFDDGGGEAGAPGEAAKDGGKDDASGEGKKVKAGGSVTYGTTDNAPANG